MLRTYSFTANLSRPVHERLDAFLREQKDLWNAGLEERIAAKTCNKCGGVNHHMGRTDPMDCAHCNHQDHRDVNAAKNMLLGDWVSLAGGASRHARSRAVKAELSSVSA